MGVIDLTPGKLLAGNFEQLEIFLISRLPRLLAILCTGIGMSVAQSNELTEQLRAVKLKKERLLAVDGDNTISQTRELMEILDDGPDFLDSFDAELFGELVETIIVESNERIRFRLKNGLELSETIERTVR